WALACSAGSIIGSIMLATSPAALVTASCQVMQPTVPRRVRNVIAAGPPSFGHTQHRSVPRSPPDTPAYPRQMGPRGVGCDRREDRMFRGGLWLHERLSLRNYARPAAWLNASVRSRSKARAVGTECKARWLRFRRAEQA